MPLALKNEFAGIDFGRLADYYENGQGIEGEFLLSWNEVEQFYLSCSDLDKRHEILNLIKKMREKGFDKLLRAGTSLFTLVLSRSRRHGLKEGQNSIGFEFEYIANAMEIHVGKGEKMVFNRIEYNETIAQLLKDLCAEDID
jgi:hypothetical protein